MIRRLLSFLLPVTLVSCAAVDLPTADRAIAKDAPISFDLKQLNGEVEVGGFKIKFEQGNVIVLGGNVGAEALPDAPTPPTPATLVVQTPSYSVYGNPKYNSAFTTVNDYVGWDAGHAEAAALVNAMGADHQFQMFPWGACEVTVGVYLCDSLVQRFVTDSGDKPIWFNFPVVLTGGTRSVPAALASTDWDDAAMRTAYKNFLTHYASMFKGRLALLGVGNEANQYFSGHTGEIADFGTFVSDVRTHARSLFGTNPFKVYTSFEFTSAASLQTTYLPIVTQLDAIGYTYYFFGTGCLYDCSTSALTDLLFAAAYADALDKPYLYQELGFTSAVSLGGTEAAQQVAMQFTYSALGAIAQAGYDLLGVTWFTLNDQDDAITAISFDPPLDAFFAGIGVIATDFDKKLSYTTLCTAMGGTNCELPPPPACTFTLSPTKGEHLAIAGSGSIVITTQTGCAWTVNAVNGVPAYFVPSASSGTGTTTITYTISANSSTEGRSLTLLIGDQTWSLTQAGSTVAPPPPPVCTYTLSASSDTFTASLGSDTVALTADTGCTWNALELDGGYDWLSVTATSGSGNATLTYSVTANTSTNARQGRFSVNGTIFTVFQAGVEAPPDPTEQNLLYTCTASSPTSPTGRSPQISWTPCRQATWNRMYACYLLNPANPPAGMQGTLDCGDGMGGQWMKLIVTHANSAPNFPYYNFGQFEAFLYQVTGDPSWAAKAWVRMEARMDTLISLNYPDMYNGCREDCIRWVRWLDWMKPYLTDAQETKFKDFIQVYFTRIVPSGGWRIGDSDQTVGTYFGLVLFHLTNPDYAPAAASYAHEKIGGLVPTTDTVAAQQAFRGDLEPAQGGTARNAIQHYFLRLAEGGGWIESGDYDVGTTALILEGYDGVKTATGVEYFPEIAAWIPKFGRWMLNVNTPDSESGFLWGDIQYSGARETVRLPGRAHFSGILMTTAGFLQGSVLGQQLHDYLRELTIKYGTALGSGMQPAYTAHWGMPYTFYNPYESRVSWRTDQQFFYAPGQGFVFSRSGTTATTDSAFFVHQGGPRKSTSDGLSSYVDHTGWWLGNWQLYRGNTGKWGITYPQQYAGSGNYSDVTNSPLMHGMGSMLGFNGGYHTVQKTAYTYTTATTGGSQIYHDTGQVAVMTNEWTRELVYLPKPSASGIDTVLIFDRANVVNPIPSLTSYNLAGYPSPNGPTREALLTLASKAPALFNLHADSVATQAGSTFTWTTRGNETAKDTVLFPSTFTAEVVPDSTLVDPASTGFRKEWALDQSPYSGPNCGGPPYNSCGGEPFEEWKAGKARSHILVWPTTFTQFGTFLNVVQVGGSGTITALSDGSRMQGAHLTRTGEADVVAMFNAETGGDLFPTTGYSATHAQILPTIRYRAESFTVAWTASAAASTLVLVQDMNPGTAWTRNIDGAGAVSISACAASTTTDCLDAGGHYNITVAGAGAHSIVFTGSGAPPPPPSCPTITLSPSSLTDGTQGSVYSQAITASGGTGPYVYTHVSGTLPPGMSLATNGTLSGTPTTPGTYTFTVRATDANACFGSKVYTMAVSAPAVTGITRAGTAQAFSNASGSVKTLTVNVTVPNVANRVTVLYLLGSTTDNFSGCTYNGSAFTTVTKVRMPNDLYEYGLQLVAATTGTNALVCSFATNTVMGGIVQTYGGVHQVSPISADSGSGVTGYTTATATSATSIHTETTVPHVNAVTVLLTRSWYAPSPGIGSQTVLTVPGIGMGLFDSTPHTTNGLKAMDATFANAGPVGAVMFALRPAE